MNGTPDGNQLQTSEQQDSSAPPPADPTRFSPIHDGLDALQSQYKKLAQARQMLDKVRKEMDELMELGDMVGPEDVIGAAGRLVGHGLGAAAMATLLSEMPSGGGEALANWIAQQDLSVTQREGQLEQAVQEMGHHLGVAGLRALMADHVMQKTTQGLAPQTTDENALGGAPNAS